ncbi:NAD-dependent epimerase/dehydratase family protein [Actinopolyspora mortivallis]|uniref:NAD-dependent dehydratase n=1 Tax=Actinopolyspora mortivallis TaxID=33906 RepID=A0A2T0GXU2_ACTMO|nr:NAD-dependent epimerase/dehydratase family protein [Actinopolyspora mortivallis]PRW63853.1 NAD-dependent dehydratase [Actinopolyspora mortivallis]
MPEVVLVTGVSDFVGAHLAGRLAAEPGVRRVVGVDTVAPSRELARRMGGAEFVRADIRHPLISRVLADSGADTVVHAGSAPEGTTLARSSATETRVLGTMRLLASCQNSARVRKLVLRSTTAVYGSDPRDPAVFTEDTAPRDPPSSGAAGNAVDVEGHVRGFARRRPDVDVTVLRFADLVGPRIDSALTRYFAAPVVPTVLGWDACLQLLHPEDALAVLRRAVLEDHPGVFNVGASGVLTLGQAVRRAGRLGVPVPGALASSLAGMLAGGGERVRPPDLGRVADTTRLRRCFGFTPRWTTRQAFDDFVHGRGLRPLVAPEWIEAAEREVDRAMARIG